MSKQLVFKDGCYRHIICPVSGRTRQRTSITLPHTHRLTESIIRAPFYAMPIFLAINGVSTITCGAVDNPDLARLAGIRREGAISFDATGRGHEPLRLWSRTRAWRLKFRPSTPDQHRRASGFVATSLLHRDPDAGFLLPTRLRSAYPDIACVFLRPKVRPLHMRCPAGRQSEHGPHRGCSAH